MISASLKLGIESEVAAYPSAKLDFIIDRMDFILLAPQLSFRIEKFRELYPEHSAKMAAIDPEDFAAMDGEKILKDAIALIDGSRK